MTGRLFTCSRCGKQVFISDEANGRNVTMPIGWSSFVYSGEEKHACNTCTEIFNIFLTKFVNNDEFHMHKFQAPGTNSKYRSVLVEEVTNGPESASEELDACSRSDSCEIKYAEDS